jgi:hypothetical protein
VSNQPKRTYSIRFDEIQIDQAMNYLNENGNQMNFSELVRLSLSVYLRSKIDKATAKNQWLGF